MAWTDEQIAELTRLWNEGVSAREIGQHLQISKNSVIGKAHRLKLESRPSPIQRSGAGSHGNPTAKTARQTSPGGQAPSRKASSKHTEPDTDDETPATASQQTETAVSDTPAAGSSHARASAHTKTPATAQETPAGDAPGRSEAGKDTGSAQATASKSKTAPSPKASTAPVEQSHAQQPAGQAASDAQPPGDAPSSPAKTTRVAARGASTSKMPSSGQSSLPDWVSPAYKRPGGSSYAPGTGPVDHKRACAWPIGDPGDSDFHFCGASAEAGRPYCPEHAARAYVVKRQDNTKAA